MLKASGADPGQAGTAPPSARGSDVPDDQPGSPASERRPGAPGEAPAPPRIAAPSEVAPREILVDEPDAAEPEGPIGLVDDDVEQPPPDAVGWMSAATAAEAESPVDGRPAPAEGRSFATEASAPPAEAPSGLVPPEPPLDQTAPAPEREPFPVERLSELGVTKLGGGRPGDPGASAPPAAEAEAESIERRAPATGPSDSAVARVPTSRDELSEEIEPSRESETPKDRPESGSTDRRFPRLELEPDESERGDESDGFQRVDTAVRYRPPPMRDDGSVSGARPLPEDPTRIPRRGEQTPRYRPPPEAVDTVRGDPALLVPAEDEPYPYDDESGTFLIAATSREADGRAGDTQDGKPVAVSDSATERRETATTPMEELPVVAEAAAVPGSEEKGKRISTYPGLGPTYEEMGLADHDPLSTTDDEEGLGETSRPRQLTPLLDRPPVLGDLDSISSSAAEDVGWAAARARTAESAGEALPPQRAAPGGPLEEAAEPLGPEVERTEVSPEEEGEPRPTPAEPGDRVETAVEAPDDAVDDLVDEVEEVSTGPRPSDRGVLGPRLSQAKPPPEPLPSGRGLPTEAELEPTPPRGIPGLTGAGAGAPSAEPRRAEPVAPRRTDLDLEKTVPRRRTLRGEAPTVRSAVEASPPSVDTGEPARAPETGQPPPSEGTSGTSAVGDAALGYLPYPDAAVGLSDMGFGEVPQRLEGLGDEASAPVPQTVGELAEMGFQAVPQEIGEDGLLPAERMGPGRPAVPPEGQPPPPPPVVTAEGELQFFTEDELEDFEALDLGLPEPVEGEPASEAEAPPPPEPPPAEPPRRPILDKAVSVVADKRSADLLAYLHRLRQLRPGPGGVGRVESSASPEPVPRLPEGIMSARVLELSKDAPSAAPLRVIQESEELAAAIAYELLASSKRPVLLVGSQGAGKSHACARWAAALASQLLEIREPLETEYDDHLSALNSLGAPPLPIYIDLAAIASLGPSRPDQLLRVLIEAGYLPADIVRHTSTAVLIADNLDIALESGADGFEPVELLCQLLEERPAWRALVATRPLPEAWLMQLGQVFGPLSVVEITGLEAEGTRALIDAWGRERQLEIPPWERVRHLLPEPVQMSPRLLLMTLAHWRSIAPRLSPPIRRSGMSGVCRLILDGIDQLGQARLGTVSHRLDLQIIADVAAGVGSSSIRLSDVQSLTAEGYLRDPLQTLVSMGVLEIRMARGGQPVGVVSFTHSVLQEVLMAEYIEREILHLASYGGLHAIVQDLDPTVSVVPYTESQVQRLTEVAGTLVPEIPRPQRQDILRVLEAWLTGELTAELQPASDLYPRMLGVAWILAMAVDRAESLRATGLPRLKARCGPRLQELLAEVGEEALRASVASS
jgi:hypothetical protein